MTYHLDIHKAIFFIIDVIFYQVKLLMLNKCPNIAFTFGGCI